MSFQTGLSGLNASSKSLDVIGHNIANANTTGMKASRAEFAEIYSAALGIGGAGSGIGVSVANTAQLFTQGNLKITGNTLDLAINGEGFFRVQATGEEELYTRNGEFKLDREGFIVTNAGYRLVGYNTTEDGVRTGLNPVALQLPTGGQVPPRVTSEIVLNANLDAGAPVQTPLASPLSNEQKAYGTALNVYDSVGNAVPVQLFFVKTGFDTTTRVATWSVVSEVTNRDTGAVTSAVVGALQFDDTGTPVANVPLNINVPADSFGTATPITAINPIAINYGNATDGYTLTQFGSKFGVADVRQDGYQPGELTSINISETGVISARYSNGVSQAAGQVALSTFRNTQGLQPINGGYWAETFASGDAFDGAALEGRFGLIRSGALEESNVDITEELVNMIVAQRAYQANAQTIKTQDQVLQTLVNLR